MKRLFYGLLGSALFFAATGQARSDAIYWTDLLGDRTPHAVAVGDFNRLVRSLCLGDQRG